MPTWIALLRGINVGGKNKLPMRELVVELQDLGLTDIQTYIQSGNVVFRSRAKKPAPLARRIAAAIEKSHGFRPDLQILSKASFAQAVAANPYPEMVSNGKTLHLFFLAGEPETPDLKALETIRLASENWRLIADSFYLHAPEGFGQSRLAARAERLLGVSATVRNWRTVTKIQQMLEAVEQ